MSACPSAVEANQERQDDLDTYRSLVGLMKRLRKRLGISKCPLCEPVEDRAVVHEPRYMKSTYHGR